MVVLACTPMCVPYNRCANALRRCRENGRNPPVLHGRKGALVQDHEDLTGKWFKQRL